MKLLGLTSVKGISSFRRWLVTCQSEKYWMVTKWNMITTALCRSMFSKWQNLKSMPKIKIQIVAIHWIFYITFPTIIQSLQKNNNTELISAGSWAQPQSGLAIQYFSKIERNISCTAIFTPWAVPSSKHVHYSKNRHLTDKLLYSYCTFVIHCRFRQTPQNGVFSDSLIQQQFLIPRFFLYQTALHMKLETETTDESYFSRVLLVTVPMIICGCSSNESCLNASQNPHKM